MKHSEPGKFSRRSFLATAAGTLQGSFLICRGALRDEQKVIDTMLIAINAKDRLYFNH